MKKKVLILGGGVGGMSAAHELVERGFDVVVFEKNADPGGKARSMPYQGSGTGDRKDFPGEHGFRFFPGFYRHLTDTLDRIQPSSVLYDLVGTREFQVARVGKAGMLLPARLPLSPIDLFTNLARLFTTDWDLPALDAAFFANKLLVLLTSCEERRFSEYECKTWWDFAEAGTRSAEYRKYCAEGLTRTLVAARAREISTRTAGYILLQLLFDLATPGVQMDRVLNAPTNDVWIDPWLLDLRGRGVDYRTSAEVQAFQCVGQRITGVTIKEGTQTNQHAGDYYVAALPTEVMRTLLTPAMTAADPNLLGLPQLTVRWMNGIQFYVSKRVSDVIGHTLYVDSQWALTSIAQKQFWQNVNLPQHGNGLAVDVLSVDVSDWDQPGTLNGKTAKQSTRDEIEQEVLAQLKAHLNTQGVTRIDDADVEDTHLDPAIVFKTTGTENTEPLLINTAGSWFLRPQAVTAIENLFLAADYVQTYTDLATMEAANEAARRAVNGIIAAASATVPLCDVWPLKEPLMFAPLRLADRLRFQLGLPHSRLAIPVARVLTLPWQVTHVLTRAFFRLRAFLSQTGRGARIARGGTGPS